MAVITPTTFDPLDRYVAVRLQQGVPLVDADWNELEDVRRFELRAFVKWFAGDGIPYGTDGFRIVPLASPVAGDFRIAAGIVGPVDALHNVGRCFVDGVEVMIDADVAFRAQPLHNSQSGSSALATKLQTVVVANMPATNPVTVYLDVWERLVTESEDPGLKVTGVGVESCARLKREWVVRTWDKPRVPQPGDTADYRAGHSYYALARLDRTGTGGNVTSDAITDMREQQLLLPPATLSTDLFGVDPHDYRRGEGRPTVTLRDAINSLLRGEVPSTDPARIAPSPALDRIGRGFVLDGTGGIVAVWRSDRTGGVDQVFMARLDTTQEPFVFGVATPLSTGPLNHQHPHATVLANGELLVAYTAGSGVGEDLLYQRGPTLPVASKVVANTAGVSETLPTLLATGPNVLFVYWRDDGTIVRWMVRVYDVGGDQFPAAAVPLMTTDELQPDLHGAVDAAGNAWLAATQAVQGFTTHIQVLELSSAGVTLYQSNSTDLQSGTNSDDSPFVLPASNGDVWVFWHAGAAAMPFKEGLWAARRSAGAWDLERLSGTTHDDVEPAAVEDDAGGIWLFWTTKTAGASPSSIHFRYRDPVLGAWGETRTVVGATADAGLPFALAQPGGVIWAFWSSDEAGNFDLWFKRLVTAI